MTSWSPIRRSALALIVALFSAQLVYAQDVIDLYGVTEVTLAWQPATGPVAGYYVTASRDGAPASVITATSETEARIGATIGQTVILTVMAFDSEGIPGPQSAPSPGLRFNPAPTGGGDPGEEPPPNEPSPPAEPELPAAPVGSAAVALDFDGDGISDLAIQDEAGATTLFAMRPDADPSEILVPRLRPTLRHTVSGDFDGNGVVDLLFEDDTGNGAVVILLSTTGVSGGTNPFNDSTTRTTVASGDLDADDHADVIRASRDGSDVEIAYMVNGLVDASFVIPSPGPEFEVATVADLNGDGAGEVLWLDASTKQLIAWDLAESPIATHAITTLGAGWAVIGAGDFDGDRETDLFLHHTDTGAQQVTLLARTAVMGSVPLPDRAGVRALRVGDFDGNGLADLAYQEPDGAKVLASLSDGTSTQEVVLFDTPTKDATLDDLAENICAADQNGNGLIDRDDLDTWLVCLNQPPTGACSFADIDGNGVIRSADLNKLLSHYSRRVCL